MADKSVSSSTSSSTVHVEIFGQTYTVKAGADPGYVEQLAALNIADECFRLRGQVQNADQAVAKRAEGLLKELTSVLGE